MQFESFFSKTLSSNKTSLDVIHKGSPYKGVCQKGTPVDGGRGLKSNTDARKIEKSRKIELEENLLKKCLIIDDN